MINRFLDFNNCPKVCQLNSLHLKSSIVEIMGIERKEIRHSRFLNWLFSDSTINVNGSDSPVMHLLDAYVKRCVEQLNAGILKKLPFGITQNLLTKIETRSFIARDISVSPKEEETKGMTYDNKKGKIDLLIRGVLADANKSEIPFSIVIENKVDSDEHDEQTMKYFCYFTHDKKNRRALFNNSYKDPRRPNEVLFFIYLTPSTEDEMSNSIPISCKEHFVHISYQDIMSHVIEPVMKHDDMANATRNNIQQYILSLGNLSLNKQNNIKAAKSTNVMAITEEHKQLAIDVWNKHEKLIIDALEAKRRKVWGTNNPNDDALVAFWDNHTSFISTLLSVVAGYHPNSSTRKSAQKCYYRSLESKPKCFIDNIITEPVDIAKVACEFARRYVKYYEPKKYINPSADLSSQLVTDSSRLGCRLPIDLFNPSTSNVKKLEYNGTTVLFNKNCWQTGSSGNQFNTLLTFIQKQSFFKMTVEKA